MAQNPVKTLSVDLESLPIGTIFSIQYGETKTARTFRVYHVASKNNLVFCRSCKDGDIRASKDNGQTIIMVGKDWWVHTLTGTNDYPQIKSIKIISQPSTA